MSRPHRHDRALAAAAALGDLGPRELVRWRGHAAGCPECRALERELGSVLADLALAAPTQAPPASVLLGIRAAIRAGD